MKKANLGFIGAGDFISARHLQTAKDNLNINIQGIADIDKKRLELHAATTKLEYVTTNYRKILDDPKTDIVVIGTKQDLHAKMIIESLDAGKWVFCEKPMSDTEEQSMQVLAAEKRNFGKLAIGFNRRFAPACLEVKRLMQNVKRPWYIHYRLMFPAPDKSELHSFYAQLPRIHYEGCHILDLVCWLLEDAPVRVFMTGDPFKNNCCLLEYPDGSQVSFMCGSMGTWCLWKEYMEIFSSFHAITVSDFVDMRVRGFAGEYDKSFALHRGELAEDISRYGFDFYETFIAKQHYDRKDVYPRQEVFEKYGMVLEKVRRPMESKFDVSRARLKFPYTKSFIPDKGWVQSFEHFVDCFLQGRQPLNADGSAAALSMKIADALLESLDSNSPVEIK